MDQVTTKKFSQINQRIMNVENERLRCQQTLLVFLEHVSAVLLELVEQLVQQLLNQIQTLEQEWRTLSRESEDLIICMTFRIRGGNN
ncbi:hypothetical protein EJD97_006991 [Solanum chilense]|uniref:Uncharacterized protein n=1 Tax=Solanum chilense TaxID=4083 RepID=A0A6N2AIE5_SOLCI|nr:hypothetical protein EJD97_006991 [Solanum chilense]